MKPSRDFLFAAGRPFSPIYGLLMLVRERLYKYGVFKQHAFPIPVISVGNLTMGGTGKTPAVTFVASFLQSLGFHPVVVSRGYGGKATGTVNLVSNSHKVLLDVMKAGDEPYMLAKHLPGIPVLTGKKRCHPCKYAIDKLHCDIIILDDGFQHLAVARDLDLVLFNATTLAGNSRIFPGGELREPVSALRRCSAFLLTGCDAGNHDRALRFSQLLTEKYPGKPIFFSSTICGPFMERNSASLSETVPTLPLYAFCGIAHPERFRSTLETAGINLSGFTAFADHRAYSQEDLDTLASKAIKANAAGLVTTEKDMVKLGRYSTNLPLFSLRTEMKPEQSFLDYLRNNLPLPA